MRTFRRFCAIFLLCLLLAACSSQTGSPAGGTTGPKATATITATPPQLPNDSATDLCPAEARSFSNCLTPHSMRVAYGVESLIVQGFTGKGQTVVDIVSFGSPTLQQDMDVYDQTFGLPPIKLTILNPLNVPAYDPQNDRGGWAGETTLDVQIIHALAPDAGIVVLVSPVAETEGTIGLPEFLQLEQYAVSHKLGNIISQSWGASEATLKDAAGQQELQKWDAFFKQATTQEGITFFSSSGDNGATDYMDLGAKVLSPVPTTSFPADNPWITSVGGTSLNHLNGSFQEQAWSQSGGGFSSFFHTPAYQQTLPGTTQTQFKGRRGVPDIAADADPSTGLAMYIDGQWDLAGGTSASAPTWAAIMAIADQMAGRPLGFINTALYKLASSSAYIQDFNDITSGNNSVNVKGTLVPGYSAVKGWDAITGLGSPKAAKLLPDLIAAIPR